MKQTKVIRPIMDHVVSGDPSPQLKIDILDNAGAGGAQHLYQISGLDATKNISAHTKTGAVQYSGPKDAVQILFQNGTLKEFGSNGVTQEALIAVVMDRLRSFQSGPFPSKYNASALFHLERAMSYLQQRTKDRLSRGVEGKQEK